MVRKFLDSLRSSDIDLRLHIPLLLNTALVQAAVSIIRVTTTYRAIELDLSAFWLGIIAAAFAVLPIFIAVWVGRFIDRGNDALAIWIGSAILALTSAGIALWSSATGLFAFTTAMGVGHMFLMASQQMLCVRSGGARGMERSFGNYMVAGAIGQGLGPYIVGWMGGGATVPPTQPLFAIAAGIGVLSLLCALFITRSPPRAGAAESVEIMPVRTLMRLPALLAVMSVSVFGVTAQDLIVVYMPLLGAERGIDVQAIGALLTVRAAASMVARLIYPRLVAAAGR